MTGKYGCLDVYSHLALKQKGTDIRVLLDGVDVTERCQQASDVTGEVRLLCRDKAHRDWRVTDCGPHIMPDADDRPCVLHVRGDVNMVER